MAYTTPNVSWIAGDGVQNTDMNRIEGNTKANHEEFYEGMSNYILGFDYDARIGGSGIINVFPGRCVSRKNDGVISFSTGYITKLVNSTNWVEGSGATSTCLAPGVTFDNNRWYHIFIIKNPTTLDVDVCIDSSVIGANYKASTIYLTNGYTLYRRIGSIKWFSLELIPMRSQGGFVTLGGDYASRAHTATHGGGTDTGSIILRDANNGLLCPQDLEVGVYLANGPDNETTNKLSYLGLGSGSFVNLQNIENFNFPIVTNDSTFYREFTGSLGQDREIVLNAYWDYRTEIIGFET